MELCIGHNYNELKVNILTDNQVEILVNIETDHCHIKSQGKLQINGYINANSQLSICSPTLKYFGYLLGNGSSNIDVDKLKFGTIKNPTIINLQYLPNIKTNSCFFYWFYI